MTPALNPMFGLSVQVSQSLAGSKKAIRQGNTVYVSPAMHDLMKHADQDELRLLLEKIEMVTIPEMPSMFGPLPMTTTAREPSHLDSIRTFIRPPG